AAGIVAGMIALAGCGNATLSRESAPSETSTPAIHWVIAASALQKISRDPVTAEVLQPADTTIIIHNTESVPAPWRSAKALMSFPSYQSFLRTPAVRFRAAHIMGVGYDNESWPLTPAEEQRQAAFFEQQFANRAHALGLQYWQLGNLASIDGSHYGGARWAQVIDVQIQHAERSPAQYRQDLSLAIEQIRRFNPHAHVIAGLSTNPSGGPVTGNMLYQDIAATRQMVWGYWLNIPRPGLACPRCAPSNPSVAIALLQRLHGTKVPSVSTTAAPAHGMLWILAYAHFNQVVASTAARQIMGSGVVYEVLNNRQTPSSLIPVVPTADFHSEAQLLETYRQGQLASDTRAVTTSAIRIHRLMSSKDRRTMTSKW
ncbi:MAG: hypothetical protein C7B46_02180, partial [Sulfobacillus benefaciens]